MSGGLQYMEQIEPQALLGGGGPNLDIRRLTELIHRFSLVSQ